MTGSTNANTPLRTVAGVKSHIESLQGAVMSQHICPTETQRGQAVEATSQQQSQQKDSPKQHAFSDHQLGR
jgi:hypothetical protein